MTPSSGLPARVLDALRCPVCRDPLRAAGPALRCDRGHSLDVARQGYVNLLPSAAGNAGSADSASMVAARADFLAAGYYDELAAAVCARAADQAPELVLDAGAGTGFYLASVLDRLPAASGVAADLSKFAMRRAARAHPRLGAMVCDVWSELPVRDHAVDLVLNIFAPRNGAEFARVLSADGRLIVVTPDTGHLRELVESLGLIGVDAAKPERLERSLERHFTVEHRESCAYDLQLSARDVERLVLMGPSSHHVRRDELAERLGDRPQPIRASAAFVITTYRVASRRGWG